MTEIGEEMCQAEVAHHTNRAPEFLCSRPEKAVYFYKKALALNEKRFRRSSGTRALIGMRKGGKVTMTTILCVAQSQTARHGANAPLQALTISNYTKVDRTIGSQRAQTSVRTCLPKLHPRSKS